ncbi:Hint domain-containing protein [Oceaniglobus trochenteri]|uniref:Hint domain-containing protein n=1 Tax=Oceaniglobus trochenteri TaxID=2763260 RepID=UPI001CFFB17D|nr:Hint domain-containing protein [Oceaniglobus trochenteri]
MFGFGSWGRAKEVTLGQAEHSAAADGGDMAKGGLATGMVAGTQVATSMGWRPVEGVIPGDRVLTFDGGMQEVVAVERGHLWSSPTACPRHLWPLRVGKGVLGNRTETMLLPEQVVMIEADCAEDVLGDPFVLIPAAALAECAGVELVAMPREVDVITLRFADDQVVFANMGVLFFCPAKRAVTEMIDMAHTTGAPAYAPLPLDQAEALLTLIETGADTALWGAMPE